MATPTGTTQTDVLIIGAGPSGLILANVLAQHGVALRIVDGKPRPSKESRAAVVQVRTLELLDRLGLAGKVVGRGMKIKNLEVYERGRLAADIPLVGRGTEALTAFPHALALDQCTTEESLIEGLAGHGVHVEWNTRFSAFTEYEGPVVAVLTHQDGSRETVSARWAVGADGASSAVRHALGLEFTGKTYDHTGLLADVKMDVPDRSRLETDRARIHLTRGGAVGLLNLPGDHYRIFGAVPPGLAVKDSGGAVTYEIDPDITLTEVQRWFDDYFFVDATLKNAEWMSLVRTHSRIAERFGRGAVYLVGDAAHVHSPAGAQGMNLGMGDGFNLGWKLAMVARGQARRSLLASYEAERYQVARTVLRGTDRGFAVEAAHRPAAVWFRAQVAPRLVRPLTRLALVRRLAFKLFAQTWIRYPDSPVVAGARPSRKGPGPGERIPYGTIGHAGQDGAPRRTRQGVTEHSLLLFEGLRAGRSAAARHHAAEELLARYAPAVTVRVVRAQERELHRLYGVRHRPYLFLVRPDGHVGYAGPADDLPALGAYLDGFCVRSGHSGSAPAPAAEPPA